MREKLDAIQEELSGAEIEAREWKELFESRGWARLKQFAEEQRNMRKEVVILSPISSEHTAYMQEMMKGEVLGIGLVLSFPQTQLEMAEMKIRTLKHEMELEDATEDEEPATVPGRLDSDPFVGSG